MSVGRPLKEQNRRKVVSATVDPDERIIITEATGSKMGS